MKDLPPEILNYTSTIAYRLGIENDEYCRHWINWEIYDILPNDTLKDYYWNQCCQPQVIYMPHTNEFKVKCMPCNVAFPNECKRIFPILEKKIKEFYSDVEV